MLRENPILRLLIPFLAGLLIYTGAGLDWSLLALGMALLLGLIILGWLERRHRFSEQWLTSLGVSFSMMLAGAGAVALKNFTYKNHHFESYLVESDGWIARVIDYGQEKERSVKYLATMEISLDTTGGKLVSGNIILYLAKDSLAMQLEPGARIVFKGTPLPVAGPTLPGAFDYRQYLARRGIFYQIYLKNDAWKLCPVQPNIGLKQWAAKARGKLLKLLQNYNLHGREYAVAAAILLGYSSALDPETRQIYAGSGAMHVLCVSGLHVGIIYLFLGVLLAPLTRLSKGRFLRSFISIIVVWGYALLTGLSASVVRAATMFSFLSIGQLAGRRTAIYNTLAASAFFILLFNPYLLYEIGFQLSYLAVVGIVSIQPGIYRLLSFKNAVLDKVWALITVSLAAQLATGPLAAYYFHQFPAYFLLTNLWVIPISFGVMFLGVLFFITSWIPLLGSWTGWLLAWSLRIMNGGVDFIESLPGAVVSGLYPDTLFTILLYLVLALTVVYFYYPRRWLLYVAMGCVLALALKAPVSSWITRNNEDEILVGSSSRTGLILRSGSRTWLSDSALLNDKGVRDWMGLHGVHKAMILRVPSSFAWKGKVFCVSRGDSLVVPVNGHTDFLYLSGKLSIKPEEVLSKCRPSVVVAGADVPAYIIRRWKEKLRENGIRFHAVREEGYFREKIQPAKNAEALAKAASNPSG